MEGRVEEEVGGDTHTKLNWSHPIMGNSTPS